MYMLKNNAAFIVLPKNSKFLILGSSAQAFCSNTNLGDNSLHPFLCRNFINNSIKLAPQKIKIMRLWRLTVSLCLWYKIFQISYWFLQLSGSQTQIQRLKAMERLKQFKCRVLISTDLVSYILWFLSFFFFC